MRKSALLLSAAVFVVADPALAQTATPARAGTDTARPESGSPDQVTAPAPSATADSAGAPTDPVASPAQTPADEGSAGDVIVTATRRNEALSNVPLAVSAVTAQTLQNSGATDIRALNQLSPSLLVSSTSSEAGAGGARIRGIGTVGDNPGLESSVATFIDGVYRNRAGVGLTELGAVERIEVLRGPQGTLFGRNASAGLISVITAKPAFDFGADLEATYGNYNQYRIAGGITGPITDSLAARLDGVYFKRDGFLTDVISGRRINGRDRYLVRGQLLYKPNDDFSIRLIGDYSDRREECCGATYLPSRNVSRNADGSLVFAPNSIAAIERGLGAVINDNTFNRQVSITPGADFLGNVRDYGVSGELNAKLGRLNLTSITAYRDWRLVRGQDADYNNLDILKRLSDGNAKQTFKTFSQELRLQGTLFNDKLDFLIGGYFANEKLGLRDNLQYGNDYERYANCLLFASVLPGAVAPTPTGSCVNVPVVQATIAGLSALPVGDPRRASIGTLSALIANPARPGFGSLAAVLGQPGLQLNGVGAIDQFNQTSRNYAFFTHNVIRFTDAINLTLGARYTNERKTLDGTFTDNNVFCRTIAVSPLAGFGTLPCVIPSVPGGSFTQNGNVKAEQRVTGTAVLSIKPAQGNLVYGSYSRGYKAGGFNLDRSALSRRIIGTVAADVLPTANTDAFKFDPEIVDAFELGYKLNKRGFDFNLALYYQKFSGFQLNTFNGINFIVVNIAGCKQSLGGADRDADSTTGACTGGLKSGVSAKGAELEAFIRPTRNFNINLGTTISDTRYGNDLVGAGGTPLPAVLSNLPGHRLSNSSRYTVTGGASWTPRLGNSGLSGLLYSDFRYQSDINTGSDLDQEKLQDGVLVMNARVGLRGKDNRFSLEFWAQNLLNTQYQQVSFDAPLQGGGVRAAGQPATSASAGIATVANGTFVSSTQLYGAFLAEPRTYGVTIRTRF